MAETTKTTGIRLEPTYRKRLEEEARKLGIAPGTLARRLVVEALEDRDRSVLRLALARLEKQLAALQAEVGASGELVLTELATLQGELSSDREQLLALKANLRNAALRLLTAKGPLDAAAANEWAREHLTR